MRLRTTTLCTLLLVAAGGLAACAPADEGEMANEGPITGQPAEALNDAVEDDGVDAEEQPTDRIFLEGELTDEGVECPAFRNDDGELYTLTGDLGGYRAGDRVRIVATPVEMSACMQGTTVHVDEITPIDDEPAV